MENIGTLHLQRKRIVEKLLFLFSVTSYHNSLSNVHLYNEIYQNKYNYLITQTVHLILISTKLIPRKVVEFQFFIVYFYKKVSCSWFYTFWLSTWTDTTVSLCCYLQSTGSSECICVILKASIAVKLWIIPNVPMVPQIDSTLGFFSKYNWRSSSLCRKKEKSAI